MTETAELHLLRLTLEPGPYILALLLGLALGAAHRRWRTVLLAASLSLLTCLLAYAVLRLALPTDPGYFLVFWRVGWLPFDVPDGPVRGTGLALVAIALPAALWAPSSMVGTALGLGLRRIAARRRGSRAPS